MMKAELCPTPEAIVLQTLTLILYGPGVQSTPKAICQALSRHWREGVREGERMLERKRES